MLMRINIFHTLMQLDKSKIYGFNEICGGTKMRGKGFIFILRGF